MRRNTYTTDEPEDFIAFSPFRHAVSHLDNTAGELDPENRRCTGRQWIFPLALQDIHAIEPEGFDLIAIKLASVCASAASAAI